MRGFFGGFGKLAFGVARIFAVASLKRSKGVFVMSSTIAQEEIKVTPKMIEAGVAEFRNYVDVEHCEPIYPVEQIVATIFLAMLASQGGASRKTDTCLSSSGS